MPLTVCFHSISERQHFYGRTLQFQWKWPFRTFRGKRLYWPCVRSFSNLDFQMEWSDVPCAQVHLPGRRMLLLPPRTGVQLLDPSEADARGTSDGQPQGEEGKFSKKNILTYWITMLVSAFQPKFKEQCGQMSRVILGVGIKSMWIYASMSRASPLEDGRNLKPWESEHILSTNHMDVTHVRVNDM